MNVCSPCCTVRTICTLLNHTYHDAPSRRKQDYRRSSCSNILMIIAICNIEEMSS